MTLAARLAPRLPPALTAALAARLYPRFEPELKHLDDFCPSGGTAVDVGGWYGPWSRWLARRADRVVTVEPVPHLARLLAATAPGNVEVVEAAASDRTGTARLWLPADGRGDRGVSSLVRREVHGAAVDVRCVPLDSLDLTDVTLIKIDVDGGERDVLRGADRLLRRDRPALFVELEVRIRPLAPVLSLLGRYGYRGWVLPGRGLSPSGPRPGAEKGTDKEAWQPLDSFDLAAHQRRTAHVAEQGLLRRTLVPGRARYVNSVLFLPGARRPGGGHLRDDGRHELRARR